MDSFIRLWDPLEGVLLQSIDCSPMDSWTVSIAPDGKHLATGCHGGKVIIYNAEEGTKQACLETGGKFISSLTHSPDGQSLAAASQEGIIYIYNCETGSLVHTLEGHALPIRSLKYSYDGKMLFSGSDDKYIKIHDVYEATCYDDYVRVCRHSSWVTSVAVSPDSKTFASGSSDNTVLVWSLAEREKLHKFSEHSDQVWCVSYNSNGSRLLSVSEDKSVAIYGIVV